MSPGLEFVKSPYRVTATLLAVLLTSTALSDVGVRGYWYGPDKLFLNALFFSPVLDASVED